MKVKEVAEFLKVTTEELLKLLKNVSVGKVYNEDSDLDKELEKKLAKQQKGIGPHHAKKLEPKTEAKTDDGCSQMSIMDWFWSRQDK